MTMRGGLIAAAAAALTAAGTAWAQEPPSLAPAGADALDPRYGRIRAFTGDITPLYGRIRPFWGEVSPFYGRIRPFWGDLNPLYGRIRPFEGDVEAYYGRIRAFEGSADPFGALMRAYEADIVARYGRISAFTGDMRDVYGHVGAFWHLAGESWRATDAAWGAAATPADYAAVGARLNELHARSAAFWGPAVRTTGGFERWAAGVYARHGIRRDDPAALARLGAPDRAMFFLDWYDGLMGYAGVDRVDHWMGTANWTPALTQIQGGGRDARIGLVDFTIAGDADLRARTVSVGGVSTFSNGHGAAVASLAAAGHDGRGVLGVAPAARITAFNPFDATATTNWRDVTKGVRAVTEAEAGVVNLSLGVAGYTLHPDWAEVFSDKEVAAAVTRTVFVIAAGNDGVTQTRATAAAASAPAGKPDGGKEDGGKKLKGGAIKDDDDDGDDAERAAAASVINPALIVVGSVDPAGTISAFSNRPGDACVFAAGNGCGAGGTLAERFIVAPGELLLVSDDAGGVERASGTSFATPLVTGAVALLHDRWPWLRLYPRAAADIILRSAKDLGAPGTDPVYGRGLLDITASQSPLDFGQLTFVEYNGGAPTLRAARTVRERGPNPAWEANGAYLTAFEYIGGTHRDFAIPLSSKLTGKRVGTSQDYFQSYLTSRFSGWLGAGFSDVATAAAAERGAGTTRLAATAGERPLGGTERRGGAALGATRGLRADTPALSLRLGEGDGALALGGPGFALFSDHDPATGGVDPLLGFASGGLYAGSGVAVAEGLTVAAGFTEQRERERRGAEGPLAQLSLDPEARPYAATAARFALTWTASSRATVSANITSLDERSALLGVQSVDPGDLRGGSTSLGATLGGDFRLGGGFGLAASATVARTRAGGGQRLTTDGLTATAFQLALTKEGLFGRDRARLSLAQPLHVEGGTLVYKGAAVIDRDTGEIGPVAQRFAPGGARRFVLEGLYGVAAGRAGEFGAFGRAQLGGDGEDRSGDADLTLGARWRAPF